MQLIHYIDPHNYGDKEYLQNMVAMFSSPFSQSYSTDIDIYHTVTVVFGVQSIGIVWLGFSITIISFCIPTT